MGPMGRMGPMRRIRHQPALCAGPMANRSPAISSRPPAPAPPGKARSSKTLWSSTGTLSIAWTGRPTASPSPTRSSSRCATAAAFMAIITAISGSSVFIHATRYGDVELKRSEVLDMRRIQGGPLLLDGPTGDAGWQEIDSQQTGSRPAKRIRAAKKEAATGLAVGPGGTLQMPYWNRTATLDMQMTGSVDIEFHLHASERPNFRLSLNNGPGTAMRIETWDDALVTALSNESDFNLIRKIDDTERDIALRFCWDSKTRHCLVFTPAGELITDWQAPADSSSSEPGLLLQNKGHDLTLDFLRIRTWDGKFPPKVDLTRPRLEFSDGQISTARSLPAAPVPFSCAPRRGVRHRRPPRRSRGDHIFPGPADPRSTPRPRSRSPMALTYRAKLRPSADGGDHPGHHVLRAAAQWHGSISVRQLLLHAPPAAAPPPSLATLDRLMMQRHTFHGTLVNAGDDQPALASRRGRGRSHPIPNHPLRDRAFLPGRCPFPGNPGAFLHPRGGRATRRIARY